MSGRWAGQQAGVASRVGHGGRHGTPDHDDLWPEVAAIAADPAGRAVVSAGPANLPDLANLLGSSEGTEIDFEPERLRLTGARVDDLTDSCADSEKDDDSTP